jgi:glycyl-tRNA synthetase beta chain
LGVIRIIREGKLAISLRAILSPAVDHANLAIAKVRGDLLRASKTAYENAGGGPVDGPDHVVLNVELDSVAEIVAFILDRLRIQLRTEGFPPDILTAAIGTDDDILRIIARTEALRALIDSDDGKSLLAAYKRAQNILRIEDKKDGPHTGPIDPALLTLPQEIALEAALTGIEPQVAEQLAAENFAGATHALASLRAPLDAFFTDIMVNDPDPALRKNRLRLLSRLKSAMESVADLSKIEA